MKASYKMRKAIERLEKRHGITFKKEYFVESTPENRAGRGFWDGCVLSWPVESLGTAYMVNHDGEVWKQ